MELRGFVVMVGVCPVEYGNLGMVVIGLVEEDVDAPADAMNI